MNSVELNKKKNELLTAQESMLNSAVEAKMKLTPAQEEQFANMTAEISNIDRAIAVSAQKSVIANPTTEIVAPTNSEVKRVLSPEYRKAFWNAIQTKNFTNAALGEGGTAADGSYLVPSQTDPTIPNLAQIECSARNLSMVIPTSMDIKLPYQSAKTVVAAKAESNNGGTNAFATNVPHVQHHDSLGLHGGRQRGSVLGTPSGR